MLTNTDEKGTAQPRDADSGGLATSVHLPAGLLARMPALKDAKRNCSHREHVFAPALIVFVSPCHLSNHYLSDVHQAETGIG